MTKLRDRTLEADNTPETSKATCVFFPLSVTVLGRHYGTRADTEKMPSTLERALAILSPRYHELGMLTLLHQLVCGRQNLYVQQCLLQVR